MTPFWYPLMFEPVYKDYLWGGHRIAQLFKRQDTPTPCAESWECSSRPEGMSIVRNGSLAGQTLKALMRADTTGLLGTQQSGDDFPLLIKIIDAHKRLSVQVHPDNTSASAVGGEPKTEAWYILAAEPDACLYRGLQSGVTRDTLTQAVNDGRPEAVIPLLREQHVNAGDVVFVPGGRVHAIGAGILLLEVQQNSNTTYRLYDWGRLGNDGKPRELHVNQALSVIDWADADKSKGDTMPRNKKVVDGTLQARITCPWFVIEETTLTEPMPFTNDGAGFHIWFTVDGGLTALGGSGRAECPAGGTIMLPAAVDRYSLSPTDGEVCRLVRIRLP